MNLRTALRTTALGAVVLLGGILLSGTTAQAADCRDRIRAEERELDRNISRHGYYSRQAQKDRRELQSMRASCGYGGGGWGGWGRRRGDGDNDRDDRRGNWHRRDGDRDRDRDRNWRHREWERERNEGRDRDNR